MTRMLAGLACILLAAAAFHAARADTRVELLGTWPAGGAATIHPNQNFYLHLRYTSDVPTHIWVQPLFEGKPVFAGTNTSRTYPAGIGEALGWFFLSEPGAQVDAVRVTAGNGSTNGTPVVATFPVAVVYDETPAADAGAQPAWLVSLSAANQAAQDTAYRAAMDAPTTSGDMVMMFGFMLAVLVLGFASLIWPLWGLWRWRGPWRIAAAVPMVVTGLVVLNIIIGTTRDPTSHNLWPFEIVMWGGLGSVWMLVAALTHKLAGAGKA